MQTFESYNRQLEKAMSRIGIVWSEALRKRWASVFRIIYNMDPLLQSRDSQSIVLEAEDLVQIAENIRASWEVMQALGTALLCFDQLTLHSIVWRPAIWANLGIRMRSAVIYQEAVIHLVGTWKALNITTISLLDPYTRDLCLKKYQELVLRKKTVECRILSHYPENMHRGTNGNLSCASYANDICMWMAICFFRQWFSNSVVLCRDHVADDGGAAFYRMIGAAGVYLTPQEMNYFNLKFPMSIKGCAVFEAKVRELKEEIRSYVDDLLVNNSRYTSNELPHLTCCRVDDEDLPWNDEEDEDDIASESDEQSEASVKVNQGKMCFQTQKAVSYNSGNTMQFACNHTLNFNNMDIYPGAPGYSTSSDNFYQSGHLPVVPNINNGNTECFLTSQTNPSLMDSQFDWLMNP